MEKKEIAKRLIQIVNSSTNDYDAYDNVLSFLEQSLPKEKVTKTKSNKVYIAMSAGASQWRIDGVYDSLEEMLDLYRKYWGIEGTDDEVLEYLQEDGEWMYNTSEYHQSIQVSRDNKLNEIINDAN